MPSRNRTILEEEFSKADDVFLNKSVEYFEELDRTGWSDWIPMMELQVKGYRKEPGVYEYLYRGNIIYVGQSQSDIRGRTNAFRNQVKYGLKNPNHRYTESHAKKWVKEKQKLPHGIKVRYCPCFYRLSKEYENWRISTFYMKNEETPRYNANKIKELKYLLECCSEFL